MFLAAFIMFTSVSISVCPDLLSHEFVCVPLSACKLFSNVPVRYLQQSHKVRVEGSELGTYWVRWYVRRGQRLQRWDGPHRSVRVCCLPREETGMWCQRWKFRDNDGQAEVQPCVYGLSASDISIVRFHCTVIKHPSFRNCVTSN